MMEEPVIAYLSSVVTGAFLFTDSPGVRTMVTCNASD
jgi:hypothetical protein